ncbi:MAG: hypothetical protein KA146_03540 [Leptospiraceae bacterium]|nr:hypothetical protein [Leptospiraceae bacterium]
MNSILQMKKIAEAFFSSPRFILYLLLLVALFTSGYLNLGYMIDDYTHKWYFSQEHPAGAIPNLFNFIDGNIAHNQDKIHQGIFPWWTSSELKISFFRPISSISHWLDYSLWADSLFIMHAHSIALYIVYIFLLNVFFHSFLESTVLANISTFIFALDESRAMPVGWLSNRNSIIGSIFGILTLYFLHKSRKVKPYYRLLSYIFFPLALLSAESSVGIVFYLFSYFLCMEEKPFLKRLISYLPYLFIFIGWLGYYKSNGFGSYGTSFYTDPAKDTFSFLGNTFHYLPYYVNGLFGYPPAEFRFILSYNAKNFFHLYAIVYAILMILLFKYQWKEKINRFFIVGCALSFLPLLGVSPDNRHLMLPGIGGSVILASFILSNIDNRLLSVQKVVAVYFILLHIVFAPFLLAFNSVYLKTLKAKTDNLRNGIPTSNEKTVICLTGNAFYTGERGTIRAIAEGKKNPPRVYVISSAFQGLTIKVVNDKTILLRQEGGFLLDPSKTVKTGKILNPNGALQLVDFQYRNLKQFPIPLGYKVDYSDYSLVVSEMDPMTQLPSEIKITLTYSLKSDKYLFMVYQNERYNEFVFPEEGKEIFVAAEEFKL